MAGENKNLEIGVVVNEGQMSKFNTAIRDATREVSKLTAELNRAASAFKGFLSGAQMSGSGQGFRPGSGFARAPLSQGGITQPAVAIASAIKATAKESTDALRSMDQGVRTTSSKMSSSLDMFDQALAKVERRFKSIKALGSSGALFPGGGSSNGGLIPANANIVNRGGIDFIGPSKGGGGGGIFAKLMRGEDVGDIGSMIRKVVPYALAMRGAQMIASEIAAQPNDFMNQAGRQGTAFGGLAVSMMQGRDFVTPYALRRIAEEGKANNPRMTYAERNRMLGNQLSSHWWYNAMPEFGKRYFSTMVKQGLTQGDGAGNAATDLMGNSSLSNSFISAIKAAPSLLTQGPGGVFRALEGSDVDENLRKLGYAQQYASAHQAEVGFRARQAYGSTWESMIPVMRQLGTSDPWTTLAKLRMRGLGGGDLGAGIGQVAPLAGWANRGLGYTAMNATIGHVDNVGQLLGAGMQSGIGAGGARNLAGFLAGNGTDPYAQGAIAKALAAQALNGGPVVDPTGSLGALNAFNGRGQGAAEQVRIANAQAGGLGAINSDLFGGGIDNLQKARNYANAIDVMPNNLFGSNYLAEHFNFGMYAAAKRGGKGYHVPGVMAARGISQKDIIGYGDASVNSMFRNVMLGGTDTPMGQLASSMLHGGYGSNIGKYIKDHRKDKGFDVNGVLTNFGAILASEGYGGGNDQTAEGIARDLAGIENPLLRKGHFRDASAGTRARLTAGAVGSRDLETAGAIKGITPEEAKNTPGRGADVVGDIAGNIGYSSDVVADKLLGLADVIDQVTQRIAGAGGGYVK